MSSSFLLARVSTTQYVLGPCLAVSKNPNATQVLQTQRRVLGLEMNPPLQAGEQLPIVVMLQALTEHYEPLTELRA